MRKRAFTKHIKSIIIIVFNATVDKSTKKDGMLDQLKVLHQKDTDGRVEFILREALSSIVRSH